MRLLTHILRGLTCLLLPVPSRRHAAADDALAAWLLADAHAA